MTNNSLNKIEHAHLLLLDYTKGSAFWRFLYFHWNRHYTDEVERLIQYIAMGLITVSDDLLFELEQIKPHNQVGSFARRLSFFEDLNGKPDRDTLSNKKSMSTDAIEMRSYCA